MPNLAPYKIKQRGGKYVVLNNAGEVKATFKSHAAALDYMQALYANVPGASKKAAKTPWTGKAKPVKKEAARDFNQAQRDKMATTGAAMPDGSFPIKNAEDLANAVRLVGKAKNPAAAKAHIMRRARALGLTAKLPQGWRQTASLGEIRERIRAATPVVGPMPPTGMTPPGAMPMDDMEDCPVCGTKNPAGAKQCTACGCDMENGETVTQAASFVVEGAKGLFITGPASILSAARAAQREHAATANPNYMYLQGRFVEADRPNRNNAYWTTADLEMGQPTVANGPLNWLHDEKHIIGTLTDSQLVYRENASLGVGNHINATAAVWKFLYPNEANVIEKASANQSLWYSMECISQTVTCIDGPGHPGCGETFAYSQVQREPAKVCAHLRERSSIRRFGDPTFLGGAVIVPPVRPGWANATAQVKRQAAELTELNGLQDVLSRSDAEAMVGMVIRYANGEL